MLRTCHGQQVLGGLQVLVAISRYHMLDPVCVHVDISTQQPETLLQGIAITCSIQCQGVAWLVDAQAFQNTLAVPGSLEMSEQMLPVVLQALPYKTSQPKPIC